MILWNFFALLLIALFILAYGFLKVMPKMLENIIKQNKDYDLKKALQIDSFYRENGSSVLQEIMMEWTVMATDLTDLASRYDVESTRKLIQKTIGYSSTHTIKLTAAYLQHMYNQSNNGLKGVVYLAMIVASLKRDFTGQEIDPIEIIKMTITDFSESETVITGYRDEINKSLR